MSEEDGGTGDQGPARTLKMAALANVALWALSIVALIFVVQRTPSAKGLFVILAGGTAVGTALLALLREP